MNNRQRCILKVMAVAIGAMALVPPFLEVLPYGANSTAGYSWLLSPPEGRSNLKPVVDLGQLLVQWLGVCLIGGLLYLVNQGPDREWGWKIPPAGHIVRESFRPNRKWVWLIASVALGRLLFPQDEYDFPLQFLSQVSLGLMVFTALMGWHALGVIRGVNYQDIPWNPSADTGSHRTFLRLP